MTRDTIQSFLSAHPIVRGAPAGLVDQLVGGAVCRSVCCGETLCGATDRTGRVWFVARGLLQATVQSPDGSPITIDVLRPGEAFGYLNCWMEDDHVEEVSGLLPAEVVGVPAPRFVSFVKSHDPAAELLLRQTADRFRAVVRLRAISTERASSRICSVLGFLCEKLGPTLPLKRDVIAMLAGLRSESVSRVLAPLSRLGIIDIRRGGLEVIDPDALKDYARKSHQRGRAALRA